MFILTLGDFTIRGITNSEIFMLQIEDNKATADLKIDRSKYNIKFASGSFFANLGNRLIYDELDIRVSFAYWDFLPLYRAAFLNKSILITDSVRIYFLKNSLHIDYEV